jgi:predicted nucleotidyltransferase
MHSVDRDRLLSQLRALQPQLERDGIAHLDLFGSRARGDHRPDSDIDLMADLTPDETLSLLDLIGIGHFIEDQIGLPANIVLRRSAPPRFLHRTSADIIPVF